MTNSFTTFMGATALVGLFLTPVLAQNTQTETTMPMQNHVHGDGATMSHDMIKVADTVMLGDLELSGAFTRAMPPRAVSGGGFVTIANNGSQTDRLVSASSPVSEVVETHIMSMDGDVMKMQSQPEGFVIEPGETLELKPGGKHLMFINVTDQFVEGERVMVMLNFEHAGMVQLMLPVAKIGAGGGGMSHGSMDHSNMGSATMGSDSNSN